MSRFPVTEFVEVMERAGRNGTRAHLPPTVVRHILAHPAWREFLAERQKEMVSQWAEEHSSVSTGSTTELRATSDSSLGTMTPALAAEVALAASRQAFEAVAQISRRRKNR